MKNSPPWIAGTFVTMDQKFDWLRVGVPWSWNPVKFVGQEILTFVPDRIADNDGNALLRR